MQVARTRTMSARGARSGLPARSGTTRLTSRRVAVVQRPSRAGAVTPLAYAGTAGGDMAKPGKDGVQGDMLEPSVVNTSWVRALATLGAVSAAAGSTALMPLNIAAFLHVSAYGIWLGTLIFNTFVVGLTMFKNMPRQMFGRVQSVMFPKYFGLTTGCNIVLLGSLLAAGTRAAGSLSSLGSPAILAVALGASLTNWLAIEPVATKLMFQRYDIENKENKSDADTEQIKALYKQFGKWHGISSLINLVITCCAFAWGWNLSTALAF